LIQSQKKYRKTDIQTVLHINIPPYRKSVYAPQQNRTHKREASRSESASLGIVKVRVSADVRVGEPGNSGSEGITGFFVRKVVDLAVEKNRMRANACDFKKCIVGVVVQV
jgi:hypothetical protein